jgi:hypothetical protein
LHWREGRDCAWAECHAQTRVAQQEVRGDHRCGSEADIGRIGQYLLQLRGADEAVHAARSQSMDEHRHVELLELGEESIEVGRPDRLAVDVAADLDARKAEFVLQPMQLGNGAVDVLQRYRAEGDEAATGMHDHLGHLVVDVAEEIIRRCGLHPIGQ